MPLLTLAFAWLLRSALLKATILGILFAAVTALMPTLLAKLAPFIGISSLNNAFSNISPGIWFFIDLLQLSFGLPLLISAYVARFLIRRIPIIG